MKGSAELWDSVCVGAFWKVGICSTLHAFANSLCFHTPNLAIYQTLLLAFAQLLHCFCFLQRVK